MLSKKNLAATIVLSVAIAVLKVAHQVLSVTFCTDAHFTPGSAPLLTGLIVSLTTLSGLPFDPAISNVIVLYLLKVGLRIFCEYTQPVDEPEL
ncbi:hypothetical protein [Nostoc sp. FACHB-133]|uniref:hypothetical protein n=1 Tax=Nostoc sp. FACHB-133 TaxID=2692835 RepID=UPI001685665C|nr:hypothetical protein [Nostoc sp. FACHB-133]MBD2521722.1 hypothetical protein [Nostoc sp. FACHB-133]